MRIFVGFENSPLIRWQNRFREARKPKATRHEIPCLGYMIEVDDEKSTAFKTLEPPPEVFFVHASN